MRCGNIALGVDRLLDEIRAEASAERRRKIWIRLERAEEARLPVTVSREDLRAIGCSEHELELARIASWRRLLKVFGYPARLRPLKRLS